MERRNQQVLAAVAVVAAIGAGYYYWRTQGSPEPPAPPPAPVAGGAQAQHPLAPLAGARLPPLADSDGAIGTAIAALVHASALPELFYPDRLARRWVATIDNLPREQVAVDVRAMRPPGGPLATRGEDESLTIAPDNSARYARYMTLLAAVDVGEAAALYRRFYPLLQEAYEALGYPGQYFNDRVIVVIDHLLATPDVAEPIRLAHPSVMYRFADPKLESLSAGRKALLRIGRDNAAEVKKKLRALRAEIAGQT
jgi:Protein of unknown function (DUF3014)